MREFGKISCRFWSRPEIQEWSLHTRLMALYLLSSEHCNLIGCFRLPLGYIKDDLKFTDKRVAQALEQLTHSQFITWCPKTRWLLITNYLKFNPIDNPNQGKAALHLLKDIPESFIARHSIIQALHPYKDKLPIEFLSYYSEIPSKSPVQNSSTDKKPEITADLHNTFQVFWQLQIRKEKKIKAQQEWNKCGLHINSQLAQQVIECWQQQKQCRPQYRDPLKTPLPHNWLANRQWEDEYIHLNDTNNHPQSNLNKQEQLESVNNTEAQHWALSSNLEKVINE